MSDRMAVFNEGRIEQIGTPAEVYEHPADRVRRRLRRHLERARARRPPLHDPPGEDPHDRGTAPASPAWCARSSTSGWSPATSSTSTPAASSSSCDRTSRRRRTGTRGTGKRVRLAWRPEHTYEIDKEGTSEADQEGTRAAGGVAAALCVPAAGIGSGNGLPTKIGKGEGSSTCRLGGLHPAAVGQAVQEGDRLQGATEVRRLVGRDGDAHAEGGGSQYDMVSASGDAACA